MGDAADEGVDAVAGDECHGGGQRLAQLDGGRVEADLLLCLAQRRRGQVRVGLVPAPAGEGDLSGMSAQVRAALGEDEARVLRPAVQGQEDGGFRLWRFIRHIARIRRHATLR